MSNIFANVPKYAGKWEVVKVEVLDSEDIAELMPTAKVVKSTWGKSLVFETKQTHYQMFIPVDSNVDIALGTLVPITDVEVVILHKEGEKDIQRCRITERPRI